MQFIGGDGVYHDEFIRYGGKNTEGALVISAPPIQDEDFILRYKNDLSKNLQAIRPMLMMLPIYSLKQSNK